MATVNPLSLVPLCIEGILAERRLGTGFVVQDKDVTYLMTNWHGVEFRTFKAGGGVGRRSREQNVGAPGHRGWGFLTCRL